MIVLAGHREINERLWVFAEGPVLAVFHDADDLKARFVRSAAAQAFAYRTLPRPEAPGECFVDDREARLFLVVQHSEIAALEQRNAHRLEITRPDARVCHNGQIGDACERLAFGINTAGADIKIEWQGASI